MERVQRVDAFCILFLLLLRDNSGKKKKIAKEVMNRDEILEKFSF